MKWNRKKGLTLAAFLMAFSLAAGIPSEAAENYRIGIGKDQTVTADQTVLLDITVAAPGGTFNTADLTFSYEKDYLTFDQKASTGLDGYTVQEENGKLRLLKYGEKQQDGKVFQLAFHTEKAGTTKVTIDSAQMDVESQAITRDAPEAEKKGSAVYTVKDKKAYICHKEGTNYGLMASTVSLVVIPVIIVYIFLQKYIIKGMTAGAVKG